MQLRFKFSETSFLVEMLKETNQNPVENEDFLQVAIDAMSSNVIVIDKLGKILKTNKILKESRIFDHQKIKTGADFVESFTDFLEANDSSFKTAITAGIQKILAGKETQFDSEFSFHDQFNEFWFQLRAARFAGGENFQVIINLENISDHKFTESALRESEQTYRILAETASDVIIKVDENGTIFFINDAVERIFGYKPSEIVGQSLTALIPETPRHEHRTEIEKYLKTRTRTFDWESLEVSARHKNGHIFPLEISFGEYKQNNKQYFIGIARDISQRKTIEKANSLLASIVESSDDAIISKNLDGIITSWNKSAEKMFGYTADEAIGNPVMMLIPTDLVQEEKLILERIRQGNRIQHFETIRQHKNGSLLNISLSISPVTDVAGKIIGASKIARDITETRKAAADLRQSRLMLSLAMQSSRMGAWEQDIKSDFVHWSEELEEIFGLEKGAFGSSRSAFYELLYEEDRAKMWASVQTAIKEKRDYAVEFRFHHADGSIRWMEGRGKAVYSQTGEPLKLYGIGIDITQRKLTEVNLLEKEERYRTLFNSVDEGFCIIEMIFDEQNNPVDYRFLEYNPMFESLTGLNDALGKTARELLPNLESHWFELYGKVALSGQSHRFTEGSEAMNRWFDVYALRLGDENSRRVALIFNNITERKQIELEREKILELETAARKSAEDANRAKDEFLSVLSHELRTPLNAILGWTRILSAGSLDEIRKSKAIETIERNARLQKNLIEDLLDVSRIISGKMRIEAEELDFVTTINSAIEIMRPFADSKNIQIEFFTEPESLELSGDVNRLQQIIVNLVNNAVKFTDAGGNVSLHLSETIDRKAKLQISDTGIGIYPDFLPYIFDRFQQADSTTIRNHSGLGLGLTIVQHLVELHYGKISAESAGFGKGATFTIELPLPEPETTPDNAENIQPAQDDAFFNEAFPAGKTVLLVDDEMDGIEPVQMLLEKYGAKVVCVNSAEAAIAKLKSGKFDLIISDLGMPGTDGFNLIAEIRKTAGISDISAIALTAYAGAEDRQKTLAAGFQTHLAKPVDFEQLINAVSALLT